MGMVKFANKKNKTKQLLDEKWKILIVDDEESVHDITKTVLKNFVFENKGIEFISAYSGNEAIDILKKRNDIAVILLDVVMETDDAGLVITKRIRKELQNDIVRIVLRTGQPGLAPEKDVIINYDINDYKEKTELSASKLFTTVVSAIRSYRDLCVIKQTKEGLKKIISASRTLYKVQSLSLFVEGILTQLVSILNLTPEPNEIKTSHAFFAILNNNSEDEKDRFEIVAASGKFKDKNKYNIITPKAFDKLNEAFIKQQSFFEGDIYIGFFNADNNDCLFLYLEGCQNLTERDKDFIRIFSNDILIAYENIILHNELLQTQKEIIETLGSVIENRSKNVASHVNRVAKISYILAKGYGLDKNEAEIISMASPMHDIGKVVIPDSILLKPAKLTKEEFEIMKTHSSVGYKILKNSKRELLKAAAIIANEHHEKYDGSGYPNGLQGEEIHLYGRIVAVADVFDALMEKRDYKEPWKLEDAIEFIKNNQGNHFDPKIVEVFFDNLDEIKKIYEKE